MRGLIAIWTGTFATIPEGWVLCDGQNGTPNLRFRFIVGASDEYNVDDKGGGTSHVHTIETDGHRHSFSPSGILELASIHTVGYDRWTKVVKSTCLTFSGTNMPEYMFVAFIMKT